VLQDRPELRRLAIGDCLDVSLQVAAPPADGFGLHGSGLFRFDPPWNLETPLRAAMPGLLQLPGRDKGAAFDLQFRQT
jgi:23S rRNA (adenine2030-N6)-methyltransferase